MGKDQDLLEASRSGDTTVIDKLLSNRSKSRRSGPLAFASASLPASLRRSVNINCQDGNGDSSLHLAALNGHKEAVEHLLKYECSAVVPDKKGCYALHLASWSGHAEICEILLSRGPSIAKPNLQNDDGETALHCAAQYGHTNTVDVLLKYHCDPLIRNIREESPLELAAQYGRLETVELLLRKQPGLLDDTVDKHSALHLASRNGHKAVVQVLIDAGFNINTKCESGTALHDAALFGKLEVVKLLLRHGINCDISDCNYQTALEVVCELTSQTAREIAYVISDYLDRKSKGQVVIGHKDALLGDGDYDNIPSPRPLATGRNSCNSSLSSIHSTSQSEATVLYAKPLPKHHYPDSTSSLPKRRSDPIYDEVYSPSRHLAEQRASVRQRLSDPIYDVPVSHRASALDCSFSSGSPPSLASALYDSPSSAMKKATPPRLTPRGSPLHKATGTPPDTPKKPPRRKAAQKLHKDQEEDDNKIKDAVNNNSDDSNASSPRQQHTTTTAYVTDDVNNSPLQSLNNLNCATTDNQQQQQQHDQQQQLDNVVVAHVADGCHGDDITSVVDDNASGVQMDLSESQMDIKEDQLMVREYDYEDDLTEYDNVAMTPTDMVNNNLEPANEESLPVAAANQRASVGSSTSESANQRASTCSNTSDKVNFRSSMCSNTSSRPPSLELGATGSKRNSSEMYPLSPTGYIQPPTPDHPPPSPMTAGLFIQETINPLDKRRSRDMETITESELLDMDVERLLSARAQPSMSASYPSPLTCCHLQSQQDTILSSGDSENPFRGLTKGAVNRRRVRSQVYDNLVIRTSSPRIHKFKANRVSAPELVVSHQSVPVAGLVSDDDLSDDGQIEGTNEERLKVKMEEESSKGEISPIDESEEWAKIADILSSCGGRMSASEHSEHSDYGYFEKRLQKIFSDETEGVCSQSVGEWLEGLDLLQYENTFLVNGFDDMRFMGPDVLEEADLVDMAIENDLDRQKILQSVDEQPCMQLFDFDGCDSVADWLCFLNLSQYIDVFHLNNLTSMQRVQHVWYLHLNKVLDMMSIGHRKRIFASLRQGRDVENQSDSIDHLPTATGTWKTSPLNPGRVGEDGSLDLYRDYTSITSRGSGEHRPGVEMGEGRTESQTCQSTNTESEEQHSQTSELSIRPPHQAAVQSRGPVRQWKHNPNILINSSCNYTVQYLGSTLVSELHGTDSTKDSINKLKAGCEAQTKVPHVVLSISYTGVRFICEKSKRVICEHDIGNIFCACQDGDNMNYFAYITRDLETEKNYCHVFCVPNTELATDIILTLGQAFEIAYQMAIQEQQSQESQESPPEGATDKPPPQPLDGAEAAKVDSKLEELVTDINSEINKISHRVTNTHIEKDSETEKSEDSTLNNKSQTGSKDEQSVPEKTVKSEQNVCHSITRTESAV